MSVYISYVYAIRRRWSCLLTHMWRFQKKNITKTANIKRHGFTVQIDWLTLIHFSLRRSGDSNLTFLTGCEMGGMTQEITHGCTSKVWSALTLRFPGMTQEITHGCTSKVWSALTLRFPKGSVLFQRRVGGWNKTVLCYLCYHSTFPTHPPHSRCKTKDEHTSFKIDMHCFTCEQILHLTCHTDIWQHHWCSCFRLFNIIFWKTSTEIACTCKTQTDTCIPHSNT